VDDCGDGFLGFLGDLVGGVEFVDWVFLKVDGNMLARGVKLKSEMTMGVSMACV
jgi:hypothetical protein